MWYVKEFKAELKKENINGFILTMWYVKFLALFISCSN
ncbi:hypothetical protein QEW_2078 [Clostridioides difficile CD160]|nr:hypothetical protein QEW_2078 [Clostridioides difficile CD160]